MTADPQPQPSTPPCPAEAGDAVHVTEAEALDVLHAVEVAYEYAWSLGDTGRAYFEPFRPLTRALRILRSIRDEFRERAA